MKAEPESYVENAAENVPTRSIVGDVIGDTAYSERFVLKLLLKVANRDTLLQAMKEPDFEQELCTLWDMTAERDVVLYLLTHETLNLFTFALPAIDSPRIIEIIIGTIANMCCHKEAVNSLKTKENLMSFLMDYLKSDDSHILIQLFRLFTFCIYECDDLLFWLEWFKKCDYVNTLYFILKNSSNKELIMTALENLNTLCSQSESPIDHKAFEMFITPEANDALHTAYIEYCKNASSDEKLGRLYIIILQMILSLTKRQYSNEFDPTNGEPFDNTDSAINLLQDILVSYESRVSDNDIDSDFVDVLHAVYMFTVTFETGNICGPDKYVTPCLNMWKALIGNGKRKKENDLNRDILFDVKIELAFIICPYMVHCSDENFLKVMDDIGDEYEDIINADIEYGPEIARRLSNHRLRSTEAA